MALTPQGVTYCSIASYVDKGKVWSDLLSLNINEIVN